MTQPLLPLPIWGTPHPGDLDLIKAAKASLNLDFLVVPVQAVPGGPGRVLALREKPTHLCDYAMVRDPDLAANLEAALRWVLTPIEDPRATLLIDMLRELWGPEVREISTEELAREEWGI